MTPRPFIPVPNTVKVEMRYTCFGQKLENVFYFSGPNPILLEMGTILGGSLVTWASTYVLSALPATVSLQSIAITDMSAFDSWKLEYTTGLPLVGLASGAAEPLNVTAAVKLTTAKHGRNFTGRNYWPAMVHDFVSNNQINGAGQIALKSAYEALIAIASPGDSLAKLAVVSFIFAKAYRAIGLATPVTHASVDPNLDSQRRRLTSRGQ